MKYDGNVNLILLRDAIILTFYILSNEFNKRGLSIKFGKHYQL